jgi:hypothetical protein
MGWTPGCLGWTPVWTGGGHGGCGPPEHPPWSERCSARPSAAVDMTARGRLVAVIDVAVQRSVRSGHHRPNVRPHHGSVTTAGTAAVRPDSDGGHELGRRVRSRPPDLMLRRSRTHGVGSCQGAWKEQVPDRGLGLLGCEARWSGGIVGEKARTAFRSWLACTHSGPRDRGPHDGESGPGLLSQVSGRVAGSCENASAPGSGLLRCWLQLGQDMEAAGQQPPGDRHGGDVAAAAAANWA